MHQIGYNLMDSYYQASTPVKMMLTHHATSAATAAFGGPVGYGVWLTAMGLGVSTTSHAWTDWLLGGSKRLWNAVDTSLGTGDDNTPSAYIPLSTPDFRSSADVLSYLSTQYGNEKAADAIAPRPKQTKKRRKLK
jgi:hypothetical protein